MSAIISSLNVSNNIPYDVSSPKSYSFTSHMWTQGEVSHTLWMHILPWKEGVKT